MAGIESPSRQDDVYAYNSKGGHEVHAACHLTDPIDNRCPPKVSLPSEIWLEIFAMLSYIPGAFSTTDAAAIEAFAEDTHRVSLHGRYRDTMATKLAVSLVCSRWRNLAFPFLFGYVLVKSGKHALKIAATLAAAQSSSRPGWWIKRLEVSTEGPHWWEDQHQLAILQILTHAPNLVVFSDMFCTSTSNTLDYTLIAGQLSTLCEKASLRRLEWDPSSTEVFESVLNNMPSLVVLLLSRTHRDTHRSNFSINLPNLKTLAVGRGVRMSQIQKIRAPSLINVAFFRIVSQNDHMVVDFFTEHAPPLKRLRYMLATPIMNNFPMTSWVSLTDLTLDFTAIAKIDNMVIPLFPCLERLRLAGVHLFYRKSDFWHNFMFSFIAKASSPSLKTLGLYLPVARGGRDGPLPIIFTGPLVKPWIDACEERGILVEASLGSDEHTADIWQPFSPLLLHG